MIKEKGFVVYVIVGIIAIGALVAGIFAYSNSDDEAMMEDEGHMNDDSMMIEDNEMMDEGEMMVDEGGEEMMEGDEMMMESTYMGDVLAGKKAVLLDFNKDDYEKAIKSDKLIALYFYANWCPICKAEFPEMQKVFAGLKDNNVIGFRVNYNDNKTDDYEKGLAREFGVAYQHTKVFLKDGKRVLKSPEGWDEARYISEINKFIN